MSPQPLPSSDNPATTPERILECAAALFAQHGYERTTIRQISEAAGVNLAAINYHFSDKEALYFEVLSRAHRCAEELNPIHGDSVSIPPEEALRAYVNAMLRRIFEHDPEQIFGRLMAQEMVNPTRALDRVVMEDIRPKLTMLHGIISRLLSRPADPDELRRISYSIIGQIIFYKHAQPVVERLHPDLDFDASEIEALTDHITRFTLSGLRGFSDSGTKNP